MRTFRHVLFLILAGALSGASAFAQNADSQSGVTQDSEAHAEAATPLSEEALDGLFTRLAGSEDEKEAKAVEFELLKRFHTSGSDTIDLLMSWANQAVEKEDYSLALDMLDQVTILQPDFAEGWNKRATVHYLKGDYGKSIADVEKVLALEPRHFGALSGLGLMLREIGDSKRALEAFERALEIHPYLGNAKEMAKTLKSESGDRDI